METPLKRQQSELEAELKLALEEAGLDLSSSLARQVFFRSLDTSVAVDKLASWFNSTRALRSRVVSKRKLPPIDSTPEPESSAPESVQDRLHKAGGININSSDFSWRKLASLHSTQRATESEDESKETNSASVEVNVNSGGVVYFALFQQECGEEAAACLKFTPSRLTTQSERLGYEIARHLGVSTPQVRVIHSESEEWAEIVRATERVKLGNPDDAELQKICDEILEALELNRCLLLMGYIDGCPLHKYKPVLFTQAKAQRIAAGLGRVLLLDLVLRNEDRLPCQQLGWRGNAGNLLCTDKPPVMDHPQKNKLELKLAGRRLPPIGRTSKEQSIQSAVAEAEHILPAPVHLVAIDSGVPRRPPAQKRELDKTQFPRFVEMLLNDLDTASEVLKEISGEYLASHDDKTGTFDSIGITKAFRSGFQAALKDMLVLRTFLLKLQRRLEHRLKQFVADISENLPSDWSPEKSSSPGSATSSPNIENRVSPQSKLGRRFTLQLKDFNKLAKVDDGIQERVEHWDEVLGSEGYKLCQAHGFVTGFLEGGGPHSVVDSYELKIRLEHILERMDLITKGSETERPSRVLDFLYVGGALAAKSFHILEHIGITHILCLCPIEVGCPEPDVLQRFSYKSCQVLDIEEEDIARHFKEACDFIEDCEKGGEKILVHCFEGKSRSPTIILAYLIIHKGQTLLNAWNHLKTVHPRSLPNDAFMKTLGELEQQHHGKSTMDWQQRKPAARLCPICQKNVGLSANSLVHHLNRFHQGITPQ